MLAPRSFAAVAVTVLFYGCSSDPAPAAEPSRGRGGGGRGVGGGSGGPAAGAAGAGSAQGANGGGGGTAQAGGGAGFAGAAGQGTGGTDLTGSGGSSVAGGSPASGGAGSGGAASGGSAGSSGVASAGGAPSVSCAVLYVAPTGIDLPGGGCDKAQPLRTVGQALAEAHKAPVTEIRVCAGTYDEKEALVVDVPVALMGSYSCATWELPGGVTAATATSELRTSTLTSVLIRPAAAPKEAGGRATLDGFRIQRAAGPAPSGRAVGLQLEAGALATVRRTTVDLRPAAAAPSEAPVAASVALLVDAGSSAEISGNIFQAGPGTISVSGGVASLGAFVESPAAGFVFQANEVRGGAGVSLADSTGSAGMVLALGSAPVVLEGNVVRAGEGTYGSMLSAAGRRVGSVGLQVYQRVAGGRLDIVGGSLDGGLARTLSDTSVVAQALSVVGLGGPSPAAVTLSRVRAYGGDAGPLGKPSFVRTYALVGAGTTFTAVSSLFHGGGALRRTPFTRTAELFESSLTGSFVTLVGGVAPAGAAAASDDANAVVFMVVGKSVEISLSDSIIATAAPNTTGIYAEASACVIGQTPYSLTANRVAFVYPESAPGSTTSTFGGFARGQTGCPILPAFDAKSITGASAFMTATSPFHIGAAEELPAAARVAACTSSEACLPAVFAGYTGAVAEAVEVGKEGFVPHCAGASALTAGAQAASANAGLDLNGKPRTSLGRALGSLGVICPASE